MTDALHRVTLAGPRSAGTGSLERCIRERRSVRDFGVQPLSAGDIGQLLWAAQGVTGAESERAAPSAGALYPLELYAAIGEVGSLASGVYRYLAGAHQLLQMASGFSRERLVAATLGQDWIARAPAVVCIAADFQRTTVKYGRRGRGYVYLEAGHAAENLMLQAVALGLAATMVGAFSDDAVSRLFQLHADEVPLCLIPVGHAATRLGARGEGE